MPAKKQASLKAANKGGVKKASAQKGKKGPKPIQQEDPQPQMLRLVGRDGVAVEVKGEFLLIHSPISIRLMSSSPIQ